MILDRIENWQLYFGQDSRAALAFRYLQETWKPDMVDGRHDIDGDNVYAKAEHYKTEAAYNKRYESHRTYMDIQVMLDGSEIIGWTPVNTLKVFKEYDAAKDIIFYNEGEADTQLVMRPGLFAIFQPEDAHRPGCALRLPLPVRKLVFKVRV